MSNKSMKAYENAIAKKQNKPRIIVHGNRVNIRLKPREMAFMRLIASRHHKTMSQIARESLRELFRREGLYG